MPISISDKLGSGAYGTLYLGVDELKRQVAVKIIHPELADDTFVLAQASALARVNHVNVVTVFTIEAVADPVTGETAKGIVYEYVPGMTLEQRLGVSGVSASEAADIGSQIIDGLESIHTSGVTHSDLHAGNVMLAHGRVKIIDILYQNSLKLFSSQSRETLVGSDLSALRLLLGRILAKCDKRSHDFFMSNTEVEPSIRAVRRAFSAAGRVAEDSYAYEAIGKFWATLVSPLPRPLARALSVCARPLLVVYRRLPAVFRARSESFLLRWWSVLAFAGAGAIYLAFMYATFIAPRFPSLKRSDAPGMILELSARRGSELDLRYRRDASHVASTLTYLLTEAGWKVTEDKQIDDRYKFAKGPIVLFRPRTNEAAQSDLQVLQRVLLKWGIDSSSQASELTTPGPLILTVVGYDDTL